MPVRFIDASIFKSDCEVLVNPVNCIGVMGAGLAKQYAERYPEMMDWYREVCAHGHMKIGQLSIWNWVTPPAIMLFPTKDRWTRPSKLEYIEEGLKTFVAGAEHSEYTSYAFPKLGCGLGGLRWDDVMKLMLKYFEEEACFDLRIDIHV